MDQPNNMQAIIDAARAGLETEVLDRTNGRLRVFVPGFGNHPSRIEVVDTENSHVRPHRKRGTIQVFDAAGLNDVLTANADAGDLAIYLNPDPENPKVVAVLNGHGTSGSGWSDFRAEIVFRRTPQWAKWKANDGKLLGQTEFAEFIEDNLDDIAEPAGAEILEIAQFLDARREVYFKSGVRLSSGAVQFQNVESIEAKVGAGEIAIPETFVLGIAPLFGVPSYRVPARFRYRIQDGKLKLGYKLQRLESMMEKIMEEIEVQLTVEGRAAVLHGIAPPALV